MLEAGFVLPITSLRKYSNERDLLIQLQSQQEQGYKWGKLVECRGFRSQMQKSIVITTGTGKELVCFKLEK